MQRSALKLVIVMLCTLAGWQAWSASAQTTTTRPRPGTRTSQAPRRSTTPRSTKTATQQATKPVPFEHADAATRAEFLKLIGANWIWSPAHEKDNVPVGDCYFRKTFTLGPTEFGQVHVAADNQYDLYVNGQLVGRGTDWRKMDV
ncbi:MAG: hypothetical protein L0Z07_09840, partial [Planctomycetes bacterium]|nr:hypothetical protein [Planctomycetota bacterium]